MNSSIQDAHNLAWKIALDYHANAHPSLLISHDSERRPVITQMIAETTAVLKATTSMDPSGLKRASYVDMLGVKYRGSPIVLDERNPHISAEGNNYYHSQDGLLCAGVRAPEASGLIIVGGSKASFYADVPERRRCLCLTCSGERDTSLSLSACKSKNFKRSVLSWTTIFRRSHSWLSAYCGTWTR